MSSQNGKVILLDAKDGLLPTVEDVQAKFPNLVCKIVNISDLSTISNRAELNQELSQNKQFDAAGLELADVIDYKSLQSLMDNFYELAQIPMAILDNKGKVLVGVGWQDVCTNFHRIHHETLNNCIESDTLLTANIPEGEFKLYKCKNGMWDIATPIIIGGQQMGNLFMGQFFFEDEPIDYERFKEKAKKYGFDEYHYISALEKVPRISSDRLEQAKLFFLRFANMISNLSYSNLQLARSIEEKKKLTESLQKSKDLLYTTLSSIGDAVISTDSKGKISFMNPVAEQLTGWNYKSAHGKPVKRVLRLIDELTGREADNPVKKILGTGNAINFPANTLLVNRAGNEIPVDDSGTPIKDKDGNLLGAVLVFRDITQRKNAEEAILKSNERFDKVLNNLPDIFLILDSEWRYLYMNEAGLKATGRKKEEIVGKVIWEEFPSFVGTPRYYMVHKVASDKTPMTITEYSDIIGRYSEYQAFPWDDGVAVIMRDITEKTVAVKALENNETFIRDILESIQDVFYTLDSDWKFRYVNNKALEIWGKTGENLIGKNMLEVFPELINTVPYRYMLKAMVEKASNHVEIFSPIINKWIESDIYPSSNAGITILFRDITEKKRAEEKLKNALAEAEEGHNTLNALMQYIPMGITIADAPDVNIRMISKHGQQIMERSESEIAFIPAPEHVSVWGVYRADGITPATPDELPLTRATVNGEIVINEEWYVTRNDGTLVPILCNAAPIRDKNGNVTGGVIGWQDITDRILADNELKAAKEEAEKRAKEAEEGKRILETIMEYVPEGIAIATAKPAIEFTMVSKHGQELLGADFTSDTIKEVNTNWKVFQKDGITPMEETEIPIVKAIQTGEIQRNLEIVEINEFGKKMPFLCNAAPIRDSKGEIVAGIIAWRDITELKKAEEELKRLLDLAERNHSEIEAILQSLPHGIFFGDKNGITRCNDMAMRMIGASSINEIELSYNYQENKFRVRYSKDGHDYVDPKDLPFINALQGIPDIMDTWATHAVTGKDILLRRYASPVIVSGKVIGVVVVMMDITRQYELIKELKNSEDRFKESERRFKLALDHSPVAVFTLDSKLRYTWVYQKMFEMSSLNLKNEDFIGKTDFEIPALRDIADKLYEIKMVVLESGETIRETIPIQIDEMEFYIDITIEPLFSNKGKIKGLAGTAVNVTDQVLYEKEKSRQEVTQLIERSARMASIGAVAGGITHEINQPLNAIRMGIGGITGWNKKNNTPLPEFLLDMIGGIAQAATRIEEIVKTVRSFWVNTEQEKLEEVKINDTIAKVVDFNTQKLLRNQVKVVQHLNPDELSIIGNQLRIELVLNNLIANAVHALSKANVEIKKITLSSFISGKGNPVITIEDNGIGLPDVPEEKLFDPFFTTKASEEGSGLGLAIVKMFLNKYGASISAYNNETGGATFKIVFNRI